MFLQLNFVKKKKKKCFVETHTIYYMNILVYLHQFNFQQSLTVLLADLI